MVIIWNQNVVESPLRKLASRMSTLINSHHRAEGTDGRHPSVPHPVLLLLEEQLRERGSRKQAPGTVVNSSVLMIPQREAGSERHCSFVDRKPRYGEDKVQ